MLLSEYYVRVRNFAGNRVGLIPSQTDRVLSILDRKTGRYKGTDEDTFNYINDALGMHLWQTFSSDALDEKVCQRCIPRASLI